MQLNISQELHGTAIYATPLTPFQPPQEKRQSYGSPMGCVWDTLSIYLRAFGVPKEFIKKCGTVAMSQVVRCDIAHDMPLVDHLVTRLKRSIPQTLHVWNMLYTGMYQQIKPPQCS